MTRIVVLPSDETACGWYRMRLPAGAVRQARPDWEIEVYRPSDVKLGTGPDGALVGVVGLPDPASIDLLVMQRISSRAQLEFIQWVRSKGAAVVVDSDDAMWAIDPQNTAWEWWNKPQRWRWLDAAAEVADLTTVTTQALARRYGQHGRAEVLPNCVPAELRDALTSVRADLDPRVTVGWAGFTATHPRDLDEVGWAMNTVQSVSDVLFRVIGDAAGAQKAWKVGVEQVNPAPMGMPYYTALTTLDIGVVPLQDSRFNRAKSYLKALEFAACGVAVIASPTPANRELAKTVPMLLAHHADDWTEHLHAVVTRLEDAQDMAGEARERVFKHHTYEANAHLWAAAWERALNRRARMS